MSTFEGIWTALWTPIDHEGRILEEALREHIEFLRNAGVQGLVVGGSTGEFIRLSLEQRHELLECVAKHAGLMPIIVNISDPVFEHVKELAERALRHSVAGILVLPPSYFAVSQDDIVAYFRGVADYTQDLPFLLYNFPDCVRNTIEVNTISELAGKIPLAGIKQSGDFAYHKELLKICPSRSFSVLTGADYRLPEAVGLGIKGSIGGLSNAIPELIVYIFKKSQEGKDVKEAQSKVEAIVQIISQLKFPLDIGALMKARGLEIGVPKIPCSAQSLRIQDQIAKTLYTSF